MARPSRWLTSLETVWRLYGLHASESDTEWIHILFDLRHGETAVPDLRGLPLNGPPESSDWHFTAGHDAKAYEEEDPPIEKVLREYGWLIADCTAAATLTALRGRDLVRAWVAVTSGEHIGTLSSASLARALFESGLEAFRVAAAVHGALADAPKASGTVVCFADGIWVPLFRLLGGEKTALVAPREMTRNTLSNIKWLKSAKATEVLAADYNVLSEYLHAGGDTTTSSSSRLVEQAELLLLATGASCTLQAYQMFRRSVLLVQELEEHVQELGEILNIAAIGHDPNLARLPATPPPLD